MFYPKKSPKEIEIARGKLREELARELESLRAIKAEEELLSFLKGKIEKKWATSHLPPTPQEIREREKEEMIAAAEKEAKEREEKFDAQIQRKRPKAPGFEYS